MNHNEYEITTTKNKIESLEKKLDDNKLESHGSTAIIALILSVSAYFYLGWFGLFIIAAALMWFAYITNKESAEILEVLPDLKLQLSDLIYEKELVTIISNQKDKYKAEEIKIIESELKIISDLRYMQNHIFNQEGLTEVKQKEFELEYAKLVEEKLKLKQSRNYV